MHSRTSVSASQPLAKHGASAAADLAASHRALGAPTLPIEGARIYPPGIITGAVAVLCVFSAQPGQPPAARIARARRARAWAAPIRPGPASLATPPVSSKEQSSLPLEVNAKLYILYFFGVNG